MTSRCPHCSARLGPLVYGVRWCYACTRQFDAQGRPAQPQSAYTVSDASNKRKERG